MRLTPFVRPLILGGTDPLRILDLKQIRQIVELMNEHGLSYFHLEKKDYNIKLKKGADPEALSEILRALPGPVPPAAVPAAPPSAGEGGAIELANANGDAITSPMVGTFYQRPSPDADSFVSVGSTVSEGQTICIIEAMKVMNEIKAERGGTITEISVEDATPVQYGDVLFRIK